MDWLLTVYWLSFGIGLVYVVLAGALGAVGHGMHAMGGDASTDIGHHGLESAGHGGADMDADAGDIGADGGFDSADGATDHDAHAGPHAGGHGVHSAAQDAGMVQYSPFSPLNIMGFLCAFGAAGLLGSSLGVAPALTLLIAAGGGLVMALLLWLLIGKLLYSLQGSSEAHAADMVGLEAEVITPVETAMSGEIAYILEGTRYTAPARLAGEGRLEKHTTVRIRRVEGNTVYVEPRPKALQ